MRWWHDVYEYENKTRFKLPAIDGRKSIIYLREGCLMLLFLNIFFELGNFTWEKCFSPLKIFKRTAVPGLKILGLHSSADRKHMLGKTFPSDLLFNAMGCPVLLLLITFKIYQYSTRTLMYFHIPQFRTHYMKNKPMRRVMSFANEHFFFFI